MAKVTWLGDEDPSVQQITHAGHTFVKSVPTDVDDVGKLASNPFFKVGGKAELDAAQIKYPANATIDQLRAKLVK